MWSDHKFYCRPKLVIFQHNGLLKFAWCLFKVKDRSKRY